MIPVPFNLRAAREFRALRYQVFGSGYMALEAVALYLEVSSSSIRRWEAGKTPVPHAAVLRLRERLREVAAA